MALFPYQDLNYYPYRYQDDESLKVMMNKSYTEAITINQSFWTEGDMDARFRAGDQTLWSEIYGNLPAFRRRQFNFNRIRRTANMITGYQRQHRKSTVVTALENSNNQTATQFTKLMSWANSRGNVLSTISNAFDGMITTGMNLLAVWADWRSDPVNGDLMVDSIPYNQFLIDPFFRKPDLSDCNFVWIRRYYTKSQLRSLLPQHASFIDSVHPAGYRDGKFQFMPESYQYGIRNLISYDEYWYRDFRKQKLLVDTMTGETKEWKGDKENLKEYLARFPQVRAIEQEIPTTKLGIVVYGSVVYHGPNPLGIDRFPFVPVLGYFNPEIAYYPWRIQGVVRGLRDAQYLYNRRKIIELDILESQVNSGWVYKEDALVNPKDIFLSGQGRGIALKQEAQMTDVAPIIAPQIPPSMIQLSEILGKEIAEISGVNEELLGSATDEKAGILSMLRQGAGLTTLQILFDQLDDSQKLLGLIFLEYMQNNFTPGHVKRIIQEDPTPEFYHKAFGKYDAVIEEGLNTSTQRQTQFAQLLEMRELGINVPSSLLVETSTLTNKKQLTDAIMQEEQQAAQQQQQTMQMQIELMQAQLQDLQAKAMANVGLGMERKSRIAENESLAVERRAQAVYDEVKAVKELEHLDIDALQKLIGVLATIKGSQERQEEVLDKRAEESNSQNQQQQKPQPQQPQSPLQQQI